MVWGGDLHLRTSVARLLGKLQVHRPSVCLDIVCAGLVDAGQGAGGRGVSWRVYRAGVNDLFPAELRETVRSAVGAVEALAEHRACEHRVSHGSSGHSLGDGEEEGVQDARRAHAPAGGGAEVAPARHGACAVGAPGPGAAVPVGFGGDVDGITALLWLARDTGQARGGGPGDVGCQRMVARCLQALALTTHLDRALLQVKSVHEAPLLLAHTRRVVRALTTHADRVLRQELLAMGFRESEAAQALMVTVDLEGAVTWLAARHHDDAQEPRAPRPKPCTLHPTR